VKPVPDNGSKEQFKYWAFISYSHADTCWGDWLHKNLEGYRVPRSLAGKPSRDGKVPRRLFPIFRDREELPVSADLGANLKNSLERSRYLVVICSPSAAQSHWVNEEVRYYKSHYGEDCLLCLIVSREPNARTKPELECFPPAVRYRVVPSGELTEERTEPIAADARPHGDGARRARFKLLAGLLGVNFDELWHRERRRRIRKTVQYSGIILCLIVIGAIAWRWGSQAQQRRIAIANYIERGKSELTAGRRLQGSLYFAKAWRTGGRGKTLEELLRDSAKALIEPLVTLKDRHTDWVTFAKFIDGSHIITASWDKTVRLWNLNTHDSKVLVTEADKVASANFSAEGSRFVTALWNGIANVRTRDGVLVANLDHAKERVNWAEFSADGKRILTACDDTFARIWTVSQDMNPSPLILVGHEGLVKTAVFDSAGKRVLTASFDCTAKIWDATTGARLLTLTPHPAAVNAATFSPDGKRVATACLDGNVLLWDATKTGKPRAIAAHPGKRANSVAFSPDGSRLLTTGDDHTAKIWDVKTGELLLSFEKHRDIVVNGGFSPDGHRVVTASKDKTASVFDAEPKTRTPAEIVSVAERLAVSP
jgi:WD40 repeat protein